MTCAICNATALVPHFCPNQPFRAIARQLHAARIEQGMSMKDLAHRAGVSEQTVAHVESGKRDMYFQTMVRLCDVLGLSLDVIAASKPVDEMKKAQ
jgi:transcriptional regulator with XRE-family HTH domain